MSTASQYHHLSSEKRAQIEILLKDGKSYSEIAEKLEINKSTVSREVNRCASPGATLAEKRRSYNCQNAQVDYKARRNESRPHGKVFDAILKTIEKHLRNNWSPQQIAHKKPEQIKVSTATIYRWIERGWLLGGDKTLLRHKGKHRRKKPGSTRSRFECGTSISQRPEAVNSRQDFGHFEADSVMPRKGKRKCLITFVERKTRKLYSFIVPACTSGNFYRAFVKLKYMLPAGAIKSVTCDRGSEFARFSELESRFKIPFYFCDPHSPWQKGSNENTNGLIREFYPKRSDFEKVTQATLQSKCVSRINKRPRRCLNWRTANEAFSDEIIKMKRSQSLHLK